MTTYNKKRIYAVYKGDNFMCDGTTEEICNQLNITLNTFRYYRTKFWNNRAKGNNHIVIVRIDGKDRIWNDEEEL